MLFQTAGIEVSPWIPPLVAFGISFFTSMGGVSGAFLLLPFQMSILGYVNPSVSATNQVFNIFATPGGIYRYFREGRMVWPLTWVIVVGTLPGVFAGAYIRVVYLPDPRLFKLFAAGVLLYIGVRMVRDLLKRDMPESAARMDKSPDIINKPVSQKAKVVTSSKGLLGYSYNGKKYDIPVLSVFSLSLVVGVVGGIYGIGGGAIIAPFLVTFLGLPVHTVAGAALMGTFVTSVAGVSFYQAISFFYPDISVAPDWNLGMLFGAGGLCGMYLGARFQKYVSPKVIKWMLASIIAFTGIRYVSAFFGL